MVLSSENPRRNEPRRGSGLGKFHCSGSTPLRRGETAMGPTGFHRASGQAFALSGAFLQVEVRKRVDLVWLEPRFLCPAPCRCDVQQYTIDIHGETESHYHGGGGLGKGLFLGRDGASTERPWSPEPTRSELQNQLQINDEANHGRPHGSKHQDFASG